MRHPLILAALPCLALAAVLASAGEAHAGPYLGVDLDLGTAFRDRVDFSYGLGGRLGYKVNVPGTFIWLLPEVGGHFMTFGRDNGLGSFNRAGTAFLGMRLGLQGVVQPNVFAHLGVGFVGGSQLGPEADIGAGLDFKI